MQCFCGCGRKVGVTRRAANKNGAAAEILNTALDTHNFEDEPDHETLVLLRDRGQEWRDTFASVIHGESRLRDLSNADWEQWRDIAFRVVREADKNHAKMGDWLVAEGLTPTEGAEKMAAMTPDEQLALRQRLGLPTD